MTLGANGDSVAVNGNMNRDFTIALPFDIVSIIFSHVTKSDCLNCMGVSRTWFDHIPQYTTTLWKELTLSSLETLNNDLLLRCLGPHLKKLRLQRLNECEIAMIIETLVQKGECSSIRTLEFFQCRTIDRRMLSEAFQPILDSLVDLSFLRHTHAMDLHGFLRICCPKKLTHFTFDTSGSPRHAMIMDRDYSTAPPPHKEPPLPQFQFTYLSLHATLYRYEIDYVLQQCSRLTCLLFDSVKPYGHTMMHVIKACVQICPSIQCLAWGRIQLDFVSHWKSKASSSSSLKQQQNGLQEIVCGSFYHGGHSFSQMILAHHHTLEIIRLERLQNQSIDPWHPIIAQQPVLHQSEILFEKLRIIHLKNIHIHSESLARWISHCPGLQELSLHSITSESFFWLEKVFEALERSKATLKQLGITHDKQHPVLEEGNDNDNENALISIDDSDIALTQHHYDNDDDWGPIYYYLMQTQHQKLEFICLAGKGLITNGILEALTKKSNASTLKRISLQYSTKDNNKITLEGLRVFAHNLHWVLDELRITEDHYQQDINNDNASYSETLLTDDILHLLSGKVKRLALQGCTNITPEGLKTYLQKSAPQRQEQRHSNTNSKDNVVLLNDDSNRNCSLEYLEIIQCGDAIDNDLITIAYAKSLLGTHHLPADQQELIASLQQQLQQQQQLLASLLLPTPQPTAHSHSLPTRHHYE
ncbi:hypothetical protein BDA99DRAFT_565697 [Phascolomyces articulosus]|uniref:F-box domain-containing protein n=1 Tax=Phascolomyces articulosus TaxID=60185 RepID=A0AAD5P9D7_9FUNG|nr:hypothetical protein BDA99DRAFT_565697 [Phascolomyces articulosus]